MLDPKLVMLLAFGVILVSGIFDLARRRRETDEGL